jgi:hypothetical protein
VLKTYGRIIPLFDPEYHPTSKGTIDRWMDTIDKLIRIDKRTPDQIYTLIQKTRADAFWNKNFRSIVKLRDKNKEDISYLIVFEKRFITNTRPQTNAERIRREQEEKYGK